GRHEWYAPCQPHEDDGGSDHESVGDRVGDLPEARLHAPAACEVAIELIREGRGCEEDPGPPRWPVARAEIEPREDRDRHKAGDRERVRDRSAQLCPGHGGTLRPARRTIQANPGSVAARG